MNIITKRKIQSNSYKVLIAFLFTILLALSSKISVPFYPIPMTMQTFVVLFTGVALGARYGFIALSFYILEGALGLPVFSGTPAKGIGIAYLFGPTGGYIFGFAFSAFLAGILFSKKNYFIDNKNFLITFLKLIISLTPTYLIGLIWLGTIIGWNKPILELGFYPFLLGEIFKVSLLAILLQKFSRYRFF